MHKNGDLVEASAHTHNMQLTAHSHNQAVGSGDATSLKSTLLREEKKSQTQKHAHRLLPRVRNSRAAAVSGNGSESEGRLGRGSPGDF